MSSRNVPTDLEILALALASWAFDERGRIRGVHGIAFAGTRDGWALWIGADVPDDLARELAAVVDGAPPASDPATPPPALEPCERLLRARGGPCERKVNLWYVIEPAPLFHSGAHIERSDSWSGEGLRRLNPGNWHPVEWDELLDGELGPWAIATEGASVISVCHTPGPMTARTAECGVWTHPEFRGRGHASATTSAWADILRPSSRHLIYSTDTENRSSQRVAQRLGLHPLGQTWRLTLRRGEAKGNVHPLSRLRRQAASGTGQASS